MAKSIKKEHVRRYMAAYTILVLVGLCLLLIVNNISNVVVSGVLAGISASCFFTIIFNLLLNYFVDVEGIETEKVQTAISKVEDLNKESTNRVLNTLKMNECVVKEIHTNAGVAIKNGEENIKALNREMVTEMKKTVTNLILAKNYTTSETKVLHSFFAGIDYSKITHLDMIGYCMTHIFEGHSSELIKLINKGVVIRVLLTDPNSPAGEFLKGNVKKGDEYGNPFERSKKKIVEINEICQKVGNTNLIQLLRINWVPSASLMMAKNNKDYFSLYFGINGFSLYNNLKRRLYVVETSDNKDEKYAFFEEHYDDLWKRSEVVVNDVEKKQE